MILYYINNFKSGLKVVFEEIPFCVESVEFVKPGKGRVFSRVQLRNLLTNQLIEKTFRSTDYLIGANIIDVRLTYIYNDRNYWYFIDNKNFNQISLSKYIIKDKYKWMVEEQDYLITLWNDKPIAITINNFVVLKVISNISNVKLNSNLSVNSRYKLCKLHTGVIVKVPLFIQLGDFVKIDTRTGEYDSRIYKMH